MTANIQTVSESNSAELAEFITATVDAGTPITVNGDTPVASFEAAPARAYGNGTLSYMVTAKKKGAVREVFVKVGAEVLILTGDAVNQPEPEAQPEPEVEAPAADDSATEEQAEPTAEEAKAAQVKADKEVIAAMLKGETGWLSLRRVDGHFAYAVTMDEKQASHFAVGSASAERHIARATAAGITVPA